MVKVSCWLWWWLTLTICRCMLRLYQRGCFYDYFHWVFVTEFIRINVKVFFHIHNPITSSIVTFFNIILYSDITVNISKHMCRQSKIHLVVILCSVCLHSICLPNVWFLAIQACQSIYTNGSIFLDRRCFFTYIFKCACFSTGNFYICVSK